MAAFYWVLNRATVAQRTCSRHSTRRDGLEEDQADLCPRGAQRLDSLDRMRSSRKGLLEIWPPIAALQPQDGYVGVLSQQFTVVA